MDTIHLERIPKGVCSRKDSKADVRVLTQDDCKELRTKQRKSRYSLKPGQIIFLAVTDYHGNVTCSRCKQWLKANKQKRERMEQDAKTRMPLSDSHDLIASVSS